MNERLLNELGRLFRAEALYADTEDECERLHGVADDLEVRALRELLHEEESHQQLAVA